MLLTGKNVVVFGACGAIGWLAGLADAAVSGPPTGRALTGTVATLSLGSVDD